MGSLNLQQVTKRYSNIQTINNVNIDINDGEFVVFVGPSGCGKSTLLRMIAGLEEITEGDIVIDNQVVNDLSPSRRKIAMVFQSYALYPHMTVGENIGFSLKLSGMDKKSIERKVMTAAKSLQLEALLSRKPGKLSGGQRQRVAIGRAIVRKPRVFLFDEPLSNLDAELRVEMRREIARLHRELKTTTVYVTHDQVEAMTLAEKIVVLNQGNVEQSGTPLELYNRPKNLFVAGFIGSPQMNFLDGKVLSVEQGSVTVGLDQDLSMSLPMTSSNIHRDDKVTVGVRPEHLHVGSEFPVRIDTKVTSVENLGSHSFIFGDFGNQSISILFNGIYEGEINTNINISASLEDIHLFNDDGERLT